KNGANPVRASHWVRTEVLRVLNEKGQKISDFTMKPEVLAGLVAKVEDGKLSTTQGKEVFDYMCANNSGIDEAVKALGISEGGIAGNALADIIASVIAANPDVLEEIKSGKDKKGKKLKFLQGLVMKETKGQAKPQEVAEAVAEAVK
ncbi:MAG: Asp-tRNA(Asn)/Glu-tRNA(Gln) amidotransferase GatCAB subunit B, partial [Synergistaceae bacterium]|nr:Asp-tRNA(Asn)/Glu-tRNA(Gln) amidotransferase GatCAB subunit B [Synergistaceae bacterium]